MMLTLLNDRDTLFAKMQTGALVITPNNRLSQQLLQHFFKAQTACPVQEKPRCFPYQTFLRYLFKQLQYQMPQQDYPAVLTPPQQQLLWREIILSNQDAEFASEGLLTAVQDAWSRCMYWQIDMLDSAFTQTAQTRQFQQWQDQFHKKLQVLNAITIEQIIPYISPYPIFPVPVTLIWACFNDYTPQQLSLQHNLAKQGCTQYQYDLTKNNSPVLQYAGKDHHDEYLQLTLWLQSRLKACDTCIGVVVPDLQNQSRFLSRFLQQHIPADQFNISLGETLLSHSLVAHAFSLLRLSSQDMSNEQLRLLLSTPFIAGAKIEFLERAQALQDGKIMREAVSPFSNLLKELAKKTPKLHEKLDSLIGFPEKASPWEWVEFFKTRLQHFGFPGEYALDTKSYQYLQRLMNLFDEFLQFALITPLMNRTQALDILNHQAQSTIFQTRKSACPIQILGLLEASGCTFDSVWVCGLTDQCLPEKTNLSPFIPLEIQRQGEMPHSLPHLELQFAQNLLHRLQYGNSNMVCSYPCLSGDTPNLPSPLIQNFTDYQPQEMQDSSTKELVMREESYLIPLTTNEIVLGGTSLLAHQAKCPFRAFAAHRLHAKPGPAISQGPDASERGQMMHQIMDRIWRNLGSQHQLTSTSPHELNSLITQIIIEVLSPFTQQRPNSFPPIIQEVEMTRLQSLVHACLDWEMQRPSFIVQALEKSFTINLAGMDFQVRVDRLDTITACDKKWVIDYKSRLPTPKPWNEDRPQEPQLLLYALLDQDINGLLFLQLNAGQLVCSGISETVLPLDGIGALKKDEQWSDYQRQWQQQLNNLAQEFRTGYCPPEPARESICQTCDFQSLCRIGMS